MSGTQQAEQRLPTWLSTKNGEWCALGVTVGLETGYSPYQLGQFFLSLSRSLDALKRTDPRGPSLTIESLEVAVGRAGCLFSDPRFRRLLHQVEAQGCIGLTSDKAARFTDCRKHPVDIAFWILPKTYYEGFTFWVRIGPADGQLIPCQSTYSR